jgi:predicted acylesterase/phospholipase RssA
MANGQDDSDENALYLVLDGGGARGVAHVAAWRVLYQMISKFGQPPSKVLDPELGPRRYTLKGVAGTSAGAIAAALIAAGAKPDDLIDSKAQIPLFSALKISEFNELFGIRGWRRLKHLRRVASKSTKVASDIDRLMKDSAVEPGSAMETPVRFDSYSLVFGISLLIVAVFDGLSVAVEPYFPSIAKIPYFIPIFWCFLFFAYFLTAEVTLWVEEAGRARADRKHSELTRALLHPGSAVIYALLFSLTASASLKLAAIKIANSTNWTWLNNLLTYKSALLDWIALSLDSVLIVFGIIAIIRRFLRGSVDTTRIEKDLNTALNTLVSKTTSSPEEFSDEYVWSHRVPQTSLAKKINDADGGYAVTFRELHEISGITLTVVAADIIRNNVCLFSTYSTPDMEVAKAVAASLAIPIAFHPMRSSLDMWVDGGIVSAIPAWVFRKQRNHDPDCRILAIRIEEDVHDGWVPVLLRARENYIAARCIKGGGRFRFLFEWCARIVFWFKHRRLMVRWPFALFANTLYTAAFGARVLELDASDRLESVVLRPQIGILDFDIRRKTLSTALSDLEDKARYQIENLLWLREEAFKAGCESIEIAMRGLGKDRTVSMRQPVLDGQIRIFWAEQDGNSQAVRIKHTYNFSPGHLDDRIIMPFGTSMSSFAAQTRNSQFAQQPILTKLLSKRRDRYRRGVKWGELQWCWAIPISLPNESLAGVLAIESNLGLDYFDEEVAAEADARSARWLDSVNKGSLLPAELLKIAESATTEAAEKMREWEIYFALCQERFVKFINPSLRDD